MTGNHVILFCSLINTLSGRVNIQKTLESTSFGRLLLENSRTRKEVRDQFPAPPRIASILSLSSLSFSPLW